MNLPIKLIWRSFLIVVFFVAAFLAFAMLAFVTIEIALYLLLTVANYKFADINLVLIVVCIISFIGSLAVTATFFFKPSSRSNVLSGEPFSEENNPTNDQ
jgi:hypothetical protein